MDSADYDILQAMRTTIKKLPIDIDIFHVKGHQDRTKHWADARINVLADRQADALYRKPPRSTGLFPPTGYLAPKLLSSMVTSR
jgi:hypothetical protein